MKKGKIILLIAVIVVLVLALLLIFNRPGAAKTDSKEVSPTMDPAAEGTETTKVEEESSTVPDEEELPEESTSPEEEEFTPLVIEEDGELIIEIPEGEESFGG